ncbi:MAG: beta-galactosidase trimerization domain-containing protein [Phycisphaerae bacterium]|nr:beta-galactosidase trimerization domain-containing protein [Phycisphaerae bacterium]
MHKLRFRQVHLDFHTSPAIERIGKAFDKKQWQEALKIGHVNSITCFSSCHHGWSYHPTKVGKIHPHLDFDLLRAQYDACKDIDVNVPIYITAGVNNMISHDHPEWREISYEGQYTGWAKRSVEAGFHKMCFNSPYLDYLREYIHEVVELFPDCDGIFLDIISQNQCCCPFCLDWMNAHDLDARNEEDRLACAAQALEKYYQRTTEACRSGRADMPVFHNSGHISRGKREIYDKYFSHIEMESLPTGGWGYDHFPMSAKYCENLPHDFLGITGKFHTTWGEFGGYKHPNALRYECAAMLAYGSKCSVGDQLHPEGMMDPSTYELIGAAYEDVEKKEPWCDDVTSVVDVGLLSSSAVNGLVRRVEEYPDEGAVRILLEGHVLFDVLDQEMDFSKYKVLILPDDVKINPQLKTKLDAYLAGGGKLFLTGTSGLGDDGFLFDVGAAWEGQSPYQPDYIVPIDGLKAEFVNMPLVMYLPSQRIKVTDGDSLGVIHDPYFNRSYKHFCSHQHAPAKPSPSGFDGGVKKGNILYLAHPVFSHYRLTGAVAHKQYVLKAMHLLLETPTVTTNLPSTARVTITEQPERKRYILHLLYANTLRRGGEMHLSGGTATAYLKGLEIIEDLLPLRDVRVELHLPKKPTKAVLQPEGKEIPIAADGDAMKLTVEEFTCHRMIELPYA